VCKFHTQTKRPLLLVGPRISLAGSHRAKWMDVNRDDVIELIYVITGSYITQRYSCVSFYTEL
jgi:hypothetical protein